MNRLMDRIEEAWTRPICAKGLCAFRTAFGLYLLVYFWALAPHVPLFFSDQAMGPPFLLLNQGPPPAVAWLCYLATGVAMGCFTLGMAPRVTTPLVLLGFFYHYALYLGGSGASYDRLILIFLFILCFAPAGKPQEPVKPWPIRLIGLQLALFYLGTGLYKLFSPEWHSGLILQQTLSGVWATPFAFWIVKLPLPNGLFTILTWGIIALECLIGPALYFKPTRLWAMGLGCVFHLAVWALLDIPQFWLCPCAYLLFLYSDTRTKPIPT